RRIIITGAASGIAAATMAALRERGARVIGLDLVPSEGVFACDVRDQKSVDQAVADAITRLGGLDVLINCAGLATPQSAGLPPDARAEAVIDVNLMGPWRVTGAALPALRASHGRVVNVASGMAFVALPFAPAYAMSKHGIVAYSRALRMEHGDAISVTVVYPGYIKTPIHRDSIEFGLTIAGTSPEEPISAAVDALCRAALAAKPVRDITTVMSGRVNNGLSRYAPHRFVDGIILGRMRKKMVGRRFPDEEHPVARFAARLSGRSRGGFFDGDR
ncbi:SDR family NAD(P)-dependent oxidoreductase, partial [Micromonosporaceae bacterium Da 78-11]